MRIIWTLGCLTFLLVMMSSCGTTGRVSSPQSTQVDRDAPDVVQYAKAKLGSGYQFGATGPRRFDCSGFTWYVFRQAGIDIGRTTSIQSNAGNRINPSRTQPGDLVFFGKGRKMQHVGIVVSNNGRGLEVIHASSSRGVIIEDVKASPYWSERLRFGIRVQS